MKAKLALALGGIVLCGALAILVLQRNHARDSSSSPGRTEPQTTVAPEPIPLALPSADESSAPEVPIVTNSDPMVPAIPRIAEASLPQPNRTNAQATAPKKGKDPIKDQVAREALAWVGRSEEAEAYWEAAINDPSLSAQERQDLIEDLNEDGISDPKHPSLEDLPVILSRLALIELLAPEAMDQVNADAFMEAYKDLVNLANVSVGAGAPVK